MRNHGLFLACAGAALLLSGCASYYYDAGPYYRPAYAAPVAPADYDSDEDAYQEPVSGDLYTAEWVARCQARYRSFDASTGTYLGYDGQRHYCR